jgi:hypothetical protein
MVVDFLATSLDVASLASKSLSIIGTTLCPSGRIQIPFG